MKYFLIAFALISSAPVFAASANHTATIATNPEVVSLVAAMEKNRGLRCDALSEYNVEVRKDGFATAIYSCNQYDQDGEPMANVTQIEVKGWLASGSFDLMRVKFIPVE